MLLIVKCPVKRYFENPHLKEAVDPNAHPTNQVSILFQRKKITGLKREEGKRNLFIDSDFPIYLVCMWWVI